MTEAPTEKKDVVPSLYREKYKGTGGTCGDFIAVALQKIAKDNGNVDVVKAENGIEADRWSSMNPGMQRMNLANVLRGAYLKGETITILGKEYNAKHQAEDFNGTVANDQKTMSRLTGFLELQDNERIIKALTKLFFPPAPKGPTAEERAAAKEAKDAEKAAAKEEKEAAKVAAKQAKAAEKAVAKEAKKAPAADAMAA